MELESLREKVEDWASEISDIEAVFLFGSRAKGTEKQDSDWDICCLIRDDVSDTWYGKWVCNADEWKESFCNVTTLKESSIQFTTLTSRQVQSGLYECCRVLYAKNKKNV